MTKYIGFCYPTGGLMHAVLARETPEGWEGVAGHLSSNQRWAEYDVARHFEDRKNPADDDVIDWYGCIETQDQMNEFEKLYPPRPQDGV